MSTVMRLKLKEREASGSPIKVGVIGAGLFARLTISQIMKIPGITVSIIADILKDKAIDGFVRAGSKKKGIVQVYDTNSANHYIEKGSPVIKC
jgi:predicted homoserine dehydrogenase-like protein